MFHPYDLVCIYLLMQHPDVLRDELNNGCTLLDRSLLVYDRVIGILIFNGGILCPIKQKSADVTLRVSSS